jgi:hypothetical protein
VTKDSHIYFLTTDPQDPFLAQFLPPVALEGTNDIRTVVVDKERILRKVKSLELEAHDLLIVGDDQFNARRLHRRTSAAVLTIRLGLDGYPPSTHEYSQEVQDKFVATGFKIALWSNGQLTPLLEFRHKTCPTAAENAAQQIMRASTAVADFAAEWRSEGTLHPLRTGRLPIAKPSSRFLSWWRRPTLRPRRSQVLGPAPNHRGPAPFAIERWVLGLVEGSPLSVDFANHYQIAAPEGSWIADPFVVEYRDIRCILVEEFDETLGKGRISYLRQSPDGRFERPLTALTEPFHLSFPWTFEFDDTLWMVPETRESGSVRLYRCESFPDKWTFERELLSIGGVDPIIIQENGLWYLFVTFDPLDPNETYSELHVFATEDPVSGDWRSLPGNPQICDPRSGRNGGMFKIDGEWYRIGQCQDFSEYGNSLAIYKIIQLDPAGYSEQFVQAKRASWPGAWKGPHHLSSQSGLTVFDYVIDEQ